MSHTDSTEETIFEAARQFGDAEKRAAYLDLACGKDQALRQRIEELLRAGRRAKGFFQKQGAMLPALSAQTVPEAPISEGPGSIIGRYKLLQQIGEGGCGVVYMAEQEEPVRRRVALKVIKLGMDTKQVIARFEAERQALALMDHPNIAKVLDAGATETGRPYFVMELVRGIKITDFCDENSLPTEERLDLFIKVCQAIQHAHQKGIIHRDIKPSNILVASNDGVPVPKVIDFGIAKATQGRLTNQTLFTAFEQFIGTPAYMSPEQAALTMLDVDTRTDIYSLGVLLYELLTGRTPLDQKDLLAAGLDGMRRTIREEEPARPSTRLSTMLEVELTTTAKHRHTDAPKLIHLLRGDLDWIVMRALEKDRARRYETANGFANDVQRHLNNEPVLARPPTKLYRFQKLARRNKLAFVATVAVAASLIIGLGLSTWQFFEKSRAYRLTLLAEQAQARLRVQAEAERKKAQTEAAKSQQVAQFMKDMLKGVGPKVALGRDTQLLREILDQTAERVGKDLKDQPEVEAELLSVIGNTYHDLDNAKAETIHREALRLRRTLFPGTNLLVAASLRELAFDLDALNRYAEAEALYNESLAMRRQVLGNEHHDVAESLGYLAHLRLRQGRLAESETMFRGTLEICRKAAGVDDSELSDLLRDMAGVLRLEGKFVEAEDTARQALAFAKKMPASENWFVANALHELGLALKDQSKLAAAEESLRLAWVARRKVLAAGDPFLWASFDALSTLLRDQGEWAELEAACSDAIALFKHLVQQDPKRSGHAIDLGHCQWRLADVLAKTGRREPAEQTLREALQVFEQAARDFPDEPYVRQEQGFTRRKLAEVLRDLGRADEAERQYREAIKLYAALSAEQPLNVFYRQEEAYTTWMLAAMLEGAGRSDPAEAEYRRATTLHEKASAAFPNDTVLTERLGTLKAHLAELRNREDAERKAAAAPREPTK